MLSALVQQLAEFDRLEVQPPHTGAMSMGDSVERELIGVCKAGLLQLRQQLRLYIDELRLPADENCLQPLMFNALTEVFGAQSALLEPLGLHPDMQHLTENAPVHTPGTMAMTARRTNRLSNASASEAPQSAEDLKTEIKREVGAAVSVSGETTDGGWVEEDMNWVEQGGATPSTSATTQSGNGIDQLLNSITRNRPPAFARRAPRVRKSTAFKQYTPSTMYKCPRVDCGANFTRNKELERHMIVVHASSPTPTASPQQFTCRVCTYRTQIADNLRKHVATVHRGGIQVVQLKRPPKSAGK